MELLICILRIGIRTDNHLQYDKFHWPSSKMITDVKTSWIATTFKAMTNECIRAIGCPSSNTCDCQLLCNWKQREFYIGKSKIDYGRRSDSGRFCRFLLFPFFCSVFQFFLSISSTLYWLCAIVWTDVHVHVYAIPQSHRLNMCACYAV